MPAHPQAASLASRACGAVSVPRKNLGEPLTAALRTAIGALSGIILLATDAGPEWLGYTLLGASIVGLLTLRK